MSCFQIFALRSGLYDICTYVCSPRVELMDDGLESDDREEAGEEPGDPGDCEDCESDEAEGTKVLGVLGLGRDRLCTTTASAAAAAARVAIAVPAPAVTLCLGSVFTPRRRHGLPSSCHPHSGQAR